MARVVELVDPEVDAQLWHPIIGRVSWTDPDNVGARYLNHTIGPEKGEMLYPDWSVLADEDWSLYTDQDRED
jgi:hypothetical protein